MLTISKLKAVVDQLLHRHRPDGRARRAGSGTRAGGGLGEYYSERETRTPAWLLAGDTHTVATSGRADRCPARRRRR